MIAAAGWPHVADLASLDWMCEAIGSDLCPLLDSDLPSL
jgi:hypothetical protein